jgi:hypothetical protein
VSDGATLLLWIMATGAAVVLLLRRPKHPEEERYHIEGPQVVGHRCVTCREKIKIHHEAVKCDHCGEVVHLRCMGEHRREPEGPYR